MSNNCTHDFELLMSDATVHMEHCKRCKEEFVYPVGWNGNIEDRRYMEDHIFDYMSPGTRVRQEYNLREKYAPIPKV